MSALKSKVLQIFWGFLLKIAQLILPQLIYHIYVQSREQINVIVQNLLITDLVISPLDAI